MVALPTWPLSLSSAHTTQCNALETMHCTTRATIVHSHSLLRTLHNALQNALYSTHCTMHYTTHCTKRATTVHSHSLQRTLHNALYSTHCTMYYTMHCTQRVTSVHCTNCGGCYWLYSLLALSALFKCSLQLWPLLGHSLMPLHHCSELHCCSGSCLATFNLFLQLQCIALTVVA